MCKETKNAKKLSIYSRSLILFLSTPELCKIPRSIFQWTAQIPSVLIYLVPRSWLIRKNLLHLQFNTSPLQETRCVPSCKLPLPPFLPLRVVKILFKDEITSQLGESPKTVKISRNRDSSTHGPIPVSYQRVCSQPRSEELHDLVNHNLVIDWSLHYQV